MRIKSDWHLHSRNSYDARMRLEDLVTGAAKRGIVDFGVSDHLTTPKQFEDNIDSFVVNPLFTDAFKRDYGEFLGDMKSRGATFSIGSDCHEAQYDVNFAKAEAYLESIGITEQDLWCFYSE